jgi:arylsulfatase
MLDEYYDRATTNDNSTRPALCSCLALLTSLVLNGGLCLAADNPDAGRPNIIIVMADDMGFSDLGCYGSEIKTPTIDRLATQGLRFSQFYNCAELH